MSDNPLNQPIESFPVSFIDYIKRSFSQVKSANDKSVTEKHLEDIIRKAQKQGNFFQINFDNYPLPIIPSRQQFMNQIQSSQLLQQQQQQQLQQPTPPQWPNNVQNSLLPHKRTYSAMINASPTVSTLPTNNNHFLYTQNQNFQPQKKKIKRKSKFDLNSRFYVKPNDPMDVSSVSSYPKIVGNPNTGVLFKKKKEKDENRIKGECKMIEKDYVRNISSTSFIRPLEILKKSLKNIKHKFLNGSVKYEWICNQFKSIRQDLRIQNIENNFTIRVYESHARIALQNGDLNEFNQCLSILFYLYKKPGLNTKNKNEFIGYKIIYLSFLNNEKELQDFLKSIMNDFDIISSDYFKHAITLHSAVQLNNYYKIFNYLFNQSPKMASFLILYFREKYFLKYLSIIVKSHVYDKSVDIKYCMKCFGYKDEGEFKKMLFEKKEIDKDCLINNGNNLDCKKLYKELLSRGYYKK